MLLESNNLIHETQWNTIKDNHKLLEQKGENIDRRFRCALLSDKRAERCFLKQAQLHHNRLYNLHFVQSPFRIAAILYNSHLVRQSFYTAAILYKRHLVQAVTQKKLLSRNSINSINSINATMIVK